MDLRTMFTGSNLGSTLNTLQTIFGQKTTNSQPITTQQSGGAVSELALLFETMYNVLVSKGIFTNDEFKAKFDELDLQDGVKDGKLNR
jgi:hypothetical protein